MNNMSQHDLVNHCQEYHLPIEEITSPISAQLLEFCESELFQETVQNSEVGSSSNCCYEEQSSHLSHTQDMNKFNGAAADAAPKAGADDISPPTTTAAGASNNLSMFFDPQEDISRSIDFIPDVNFSIPFFLDGGQFDCSLAPTQQLQYPSDQTLVQLMAAGPGYTEEGLSSCSILDSSAMGNYLPGNLNVPLQGENSGVFPGGGGLFLGMELQPQELDFQGDNGRLFCPDNMPRVYNFSNDLQAVSSESQHMVSGAGSTSTPLASDITRLEDSTFKVGKLSVEQRKEKIHRYLKKRNERNFSKKIKYVCRKTLADSRPRVRGRFAKNDEFGEREATRTCGMGTPEEDTIAEDVRVNSLLYDSLITTAGYSPPIVSHPQILTTSAPLCTAPTARCID